jgi:hypothetical protein
VQDRSPTFRDMPVVLISGLPRVGKSRVARRLADHTGFEVIFCDRFRLGFWSIADAQERSAERFRRYREAVAGRRVGLIIEGDDLIARNRGDTLLARQGLISNDEQFSFALIRHLQDQSGAKAFVLGCIDADPDLAVAAIRRHETDACFTKSLSDSDLEGLIRTNIKRSMRLRKIAAREHVHYLEMGEENFDAAVNAALSTVLRELDRPGAEAQP